MNAEKIINICAGMIQIPTVSGAGNEEFFHIEEYRQYLRRSFPTLFSRAEVKKIGDALLLHIRSGNSGKEPILFTSHMDVVPAKETDLWKYSPFSGTLAEGCLWGRGAIDMKSAQCALLCGWENFLSENEAPGRDAYLYLSCDEETGGATTQKAAAYLAERGVQLQAVFDEGGTMSENYWNLIPGDYAQLAIAEKGSLVYEFTAKASGGHAANPPKDSAIIRMANLIAEMSAEEFFRKELTPEAELVLNSAKQEMEPADAERLQLAMSEAAPFTRLCEMIPKARPMLGATIAFTKISGGTAVNALPSEVKMWANVRTASNMSVVEIDTLLTETASKYNIQCMRTGGRCGSGRITSADSWAYRAMEQCIKEFFPRTKVFPILLTGGTDSRHFQELTDQIVRFAPLRLLPWQGKGVHGVNECIDAEAIVKAAEFYCHFLKNYV